MEHSLLCNYELFWIPSPGILVLRIDTIQIKLLQYISVKIIAKQIIMQFNKDYNNFLNQHFME